MRPGATVNKEAARLRRQVRVVAASMADDYAFEPDTGVRFCVLAPPT